MSRRINKLQTAACYVVIAAATAATQPGGYVGSAVCAQCHRAIAATQSKTNMARTWQTPATRILPPAYKEDHAEGPPPSIEYRATRTPDKHLDFVTTLPGHAPVNATVEDVVGAERHGISFLARLHDIEGTKLARDPLLETRYLHSTRENALVLSPGFPDTKPASLESALGRALSLGFEKKCLGCHGQPTSENTTAGIQCESCHGPGRAHLESIASKSAPRKRNTGDAMESCAHCHSGFSPSPIRFPTTC